MSGKLAIIYLSKNRMLKTELLADIEAKVLKIVSTVEEPDAQKNAVGIKSYMTNVMEQTGKTARGRNIGWYTVDEGLPTEQAFYRDELGRKNDFQTRADNYLSGLVPATFLKATSFEVDEDSKTAKANVVEPNVDGTVSEKVIFVYKPQGNPLTHKVIK